MTEDFEQLVKELGIEEVTTEQLRVEKEGLEATLYYKFGTLSVSTDLRAGKLDDTDEIVQRWIEVDAMLNSGSQ